MSFAEYLRFCFGLGLAVIPFLAFAFVLAWLITVSTLPGLINIGLALIAVVFVAPALCWLAIRIMDAIAP